MKENCPNNEILTVSLFGQFSFIFTVVDILHISSDSGSNPYKTLLFELTDINFLLFK